MQMFAQVGRAIVMALSLVVVATAHGETTIPLEPYAGRLRQVTVAVAGVKRKFLFDTAGGYTIISPSVASALRCTPSGRIYALRMSGEPFVTPTCSSVDYSIGAFPVRDEVAGVFDLMTLLPKELPPVEGLISLKSFEGRSITIDLAANSLVIGARPRGRAFRCRIATGVDGSNMTLFAEIERSGQMLWFEVDSGSLDGVRLAPHAAALFGVGGAPKPITLALGATRPIEVDAKTIDIIYDGVINAAFLERGTLFADLTGNPRCAWTPHEN